MPKLSVVVTNYNYGHFLEGAISSIYQTVLLHELEVLLVDDGSTDASKEIIAKLLQRYPSIRFFQHEKNLGQGAALETAFAHVQGEYIHLFAADDLMLSGTIDIVLDYIQKYPTCPAFCSDNCIFSKWDPPILEISKWIDSHEFRFFNPENIYKLFSKTHCWIRGHVFFAKTDVYFKYTPFDMNLRMIADWWVIHQLAFNEGIGYIPHALCAQRMHPASYGAAPSLEKRRDSWLYLLQLLEKNPRQYKRLYQSGIFRIFGLRAIYKDLLLTPRYWKYLLPICRKILLLDKVQYKSQSLRRK